MAHALKSFLTQIKLHKVFAVKEYPFVAASCVRNFALELEEGERVTVEVFPVLPNRWQR